MLFFHLKLDEHPRVGPIAPAAPFIASAVVDSDPIGLRNVPFAVLALRCPFMWPSGVSEASCEPALAGSALLLKQATAMMGRSQGASFTGRQIIVQGFTYADTAVGTGGVGSM